MEMFFNTALWIVPVFALASVLLSVYIVLGSLGLNVRRSELSLTPKHLAHVRHFAIVRVCAEWLAAVALVIVLVAVIVYTYLGLVSVAG